MQKKARLTIWGKTLPKVSNRRRQAIKKGEWDFVEVSGTPDLNRYYETGELPGNEAEREMYKEFIEKGLI